MPFVRALSDAQLAKRLAGLLNTHNHLGSQRSAEAILDSGVEYVVEIHGKFLIGACGVEKQSYSMTEIKHLVVAPQWRGKGIGKFLVRKAISRAKTPLLYATVREDNRASSALFLQAGFEVSTSYKTQGHQVLLLTKANPTWQKEPQFAFVFSPELEMPPTDPF